MAFTYSVKTKKGIPELMGISYVSYGTFTNGASDCGGDILTGLSTVRGFTATCSGTSAPTEGVAVNETFPKTSDGITIVTKAGVDGVWVAFGDR